MGVYHEFYDFLSANDTLKYLRIRVASNIECLLNSLRENRSLETLDIMMSKLE